MIVIVIVFVPLTNALAGTAYVNTASLPRQVPIVRLRELGCVEGAGAADVQPLTAICGLPPAYAAVNPIRTVCAATWPDDRLKRTVVGLFTPFHCSAGKSPVALPPTVNVTGPQPRMR